MTTDGADLLDRARRALAQTPGILEALVADLDAADWRARPSPAEWSPVEIVCHLRDEEAEDFGARVLAVLTGTGPAPPIDPERWAVDRGYREADPGVALETFRARRTASLAMLGRASPEQLAAALHHPAGLPLNGLDLVAAWVTHDRLHLHQVTGTLARLWADRWAPLRTDYAGPIPYPPAGGSLQGPASAANPTPPAGS